MDYTRNPFIVGLWTPVYLFAGALAVTNDFLMAALYIMGTLGLIGAYVTEFPVLSTLYQNEIVHKVAISSLLGILLGMIIGLAFAGNTDASDSNPVSMQAKLMMVWGMMCLPAYPLMVYLVSKVNKRDLDAEQAVREEKKKNRKGGGGPPILNKDGGGL